MAGRFREQQGCGDATPAARHLADGRSSTTDTHRPLPAVQGGESSAQHAPAATTPESALAGSD